MGDITMEDSSTRVVCVNGRDVTVSDFLRILKQDGKLKDLIAHVVRRVLISQLAERRQIAITAIELQEGADAFRKSAGLHNAAATQKWLASQRLSEEDFEQFVGSRVLEKKIMEEIAESAIEQWFEAHRGRYERAEVAHIVVDSGGLADELLLQVHEESADFGKLAYQHSIDDHSRENGGYLGMVRRDELDANTADAVFSAKPPDVVGPVRVDDGFHLINVLKLIPGELNDRTVRQIRQEILEDIVERLSTEGEISVEI